ncbi:hypothetical protein LUZ60_002551 [Juncus effusus]|nr:hypothetical protein LUZ60_002551 [Juncus effusus]
MATQGNREIDEKELKGVRKRAWGRWVSEIRIPYDRSRIWLGSYDDPVKAARAYDVALLCIYGPSTNKGFNFPDECRYWPRIPEHRRRMLSRTHIKTIAIRYVFHVDAATSPCATVAATSPALPCGTIDAVATGLADTDVAFRASSSLPPPGSPDNTMTSSPNNVMTSTENDDADELKGLSAETFLLKDANVMQEMIKSWEKR